MIAVAPRLGSVSVGLALLRLAVRASSATSITIVFQRASECLPSSPRGDEAAMPSSARAAALRLILLNVFILLLFLSFSCLRPGRPWHRQRPNIPRCDQFDE